MRKKNGFTLVELLAVIVVLAIIMIIAIPSVLNTMNTAQQKTFAEYVSKVYYKAQERRVTDGYLGTQQERYDITTDLGLSSTGNFKGYVLFVNNGTSEEVYIALSDGEYHTVTQYGDSETERVNYINYSKGGEPKYSSEITKYTGEANFFVKEKLEDITMPESASSPDFIRLNGGGSTNPETPPAEATFESKLDNFYTKAYNSFRTKISNNTVTKIPYTCEEKHDHGYIYREVYDYVSLTGDTTSNTKGFIVLLDGNIIDNGSPFLQFKYVFVSLKDNNYHTATKMIYPNESGGTSSIYLPYSFHAKVFENLSFSSIERSAPFEFNQITFWNDAEAAFKETQPETGIPILQSVYRNYMPSITYVSNSFNDGLSDSLYNYNTFKSVYGMEPDAMIEQILNYMGYIAKR